MLALMVAGKCEWKDRNLKPCRTQQVEGSKYCKFHQYVEKYTEEMKQKSVMCNGCKKVKYLGTFTSCQECRERGKKNREQKQATKPKVAMCKYCGKFKAKENGYCQPHARQGWKADVEKSGKKVCSNYTRGCKTILPKEYKFTRCEICRKKEREGDYAKRTGQKKIENVEDEHAYAKEDVEDDIENDVEDNIEEEAEENVEDDVSDNEDAENDPNPKKKKHKKVKVKCGWKNSKGAPCDKLVMSGSKYCKTHKYVDDYTEQMKKEAKYCNCCRNIKYLVKGRVWCEECCKKDKEKQEKRKVANKGADMCKSCKKFQSKENGLCLMCSRKRFKDDTVRKGFVVCSNYMLGCQNTQRKEKGVTVNHNNNDCFTCVDCLEKKRLIEIAVHNKNLVSESKCAVCLKIYENAFFNKSKYCIFPGGIERYRNICRSCCEDKKYRHAMIDKYAKVIISVPKQLCNSCQRMKPVAEFGVFKTCVKCRAKDSTPQRVEWKKEWKENNYEKCVGYWMEYREKQIKKLGIDEYFHRNAVKHLKYMKTHPDIYQKLQDWKKTNVGQLFGMYQREAEYKGIQFELSKEFCFKKFDEQCFYCGTLPEGNYHNGIDRMLNDLPYCETNCVPCCKMCNFMKGCLDVDIFIRRVEHILTHLGIVKGRLFPGDFPDCHAERFGRYKYRAKGKGLCFELTQLNYEYYTMVSECYLCGKRSSLFHKNGIDRFDNSCGYTLWNCFPCCSECNYMKKNYKYDDFVKKLKQIYDIHKWENRSQPNDEKEIGISKNNNETDENSDDVVEDNNENGDEQDGTFPNEPNYDTTKEPIIEKIQNIVRKCGNESLDEKFGKLMDMRRVNGLSPHKYHSGKKQLSNAERCKMYKEKQKQKLGEKKYAEKIRTQKAKERHRKIIGNEHRHKLTKEEKAERNRLKQQRHRQNMKEKIGNVEYKLKHAKEIAEYRKKKREAT